MNSIEDQKQIVSIAVKYFLDMMGATEAPIDDARLEEIEKSSGTNNWLITVSYVEKAQNGTFAALYGNKERIYKIITVDGDSKTAISMKSKQIA